MAQRFQPAMARRPARDLSEFNTGNRAKFANYRRVELKPRAANQPSHSGLDQMPFASQR